ncbi:MAG: SDR family oxidoreductase [Actinobacteria bacterium]|nr:SDR family oxidoreductase [Actinomycetota bacterium]
MAGMIDFTGKVAWVAGAARRPGIGAAVARLLARHGADVACVDVVVDEPTDADTYRVGRDALDAVVDAVEAEGARAIGLAVDLTDADRVGESVARTVEALGRVDVCVNASGGTGPRYGTGPLLDVSVATWHRTLDANLTATWLGAQACARQMVEQGDGGAIVSLASSAALTGEPNFGAFSAARAGVVRMTEVLAVELAPHRIRANSVCPLGVAPSAGGGNPGLEYTAGAQKGSVDDWVRDLIPLGRMQSPEETAAVMVFLCSDAASFVTGEHVQVTGGARF